MGGPRATRLALQPPRTIARLPRRSPAAPPGRSRAGTYVKACLRQNTSWRRAKRRAAARVPLRPATQPPKEMLSHYRMELGGGRLHSSLRAVARSAAITPIRESVAGRAAPRPHSSAWVPPSAPRSASMRYPSWCCSTPYFGVRAACRRFQRSGLPRLYPPCLLPEGTSPARPWPLIDAVHDQDAHPRRRDYLLTFTKSAASRTARWFSGRNG